MERPKERACLLIEKVVPRKREEPLIVWGNRNVAKSVLDVSFHDNGTSVFTENEIKDLLQFGII